MPVTKTEEESKIDSALLLAWVQSNSPENIVEVKEKLQEVNISHSESTTAYDPDTGTIYLCEGSSKFNLNHELVHLISHKNRGQEDERVGIDCNVFSIAPNEALTELATFVITKGAAYMKDTQYAQIIMDYRSISNLEPGYLYATEYLIRRVKERSLDETKINHLIGVYLFKEGTAKSVVEDIQTILKIDNLEKGIEDYQREKGFELLSNVWEMFKEGERSEEWSNMTIDLNGQKVSLQQLFQPFEIALSNKNLRPFWSINRERENLHKQASKLAGIESDLSVDMTLLHILMNEVEKPEMKQAIRVYLIRKAMNLYKAVFGISG